MNIIYVEPYYSGSHKKWIDSYKKYSKHNIEILHLPGNKWKWRMHGGAITLANQFLDLKEKANLILCSDFLNLPVFKSICGDKIKDILYAKSSDKVDGYRPEVAADTFGEPPRPEEEVADAVASAAANISGEVAAAHDSQAEE